MSGYGKSLPYRALRRARRSPGFQRMSGRILDKIRSSEEARELANRIFAGTASPAGNSGFRRHPPVGNLLGGIGLDNLPVAMISLLSTAEEHFDEVVDEIARLQVLTAAFRPIFVMTKPRLDAPRRYGWATELLLDPADWNQPGESWAEYAATRIADAVAIHQPAVMINIPDGGVDDLVRPIFYGLNQNVCSPNLRAAQVPDWDL